jgi:hypothetical protein
VPSVVLLSATVGVEFVLQQTPRAVMDAPPSEIILPPHSAVVSVIPLIVDVVTMGTVGLSGLVPVSSSSPQPPANRTVKIIMTDKMNLYGFLSDCSSSDPVGQISGLT